mgnify:CR=1 FL=1
MTEDTSPENLRKFLESDDPALVRMGLSMMKNIEIPKDLFPHLCILTFDTINNRTGPNVHEVHRVWGEIRDEAESIIENKDLDDWNVDPHIPEFGERDADFWRLGNADLVVKQLEKTEWLWGYFRESPDENGYYDLNEVISNFPWKADAFSDGGERAEKLLRGILDGDFVDLKWRWRMEMELDHGLILQESAEEALVKLGKMNSEDSIWDDQDMDGDEYVLKELNNMSITDLRERCENNELKLSGSKKELIERLYDSVDEINYLL